MARFLKGLKKSKRMVTVLEMEYELTNKSDAKGNVSWDNFCKVVEDLKILYNITREELREIFNNNLNDQRKFHV